MRKFLISLLLASALTPAAASAQDGDRGHRARAEHNDSERASPPKDRPQRAMREQRSNDSEQAVHVERTERPVRIERVQRAERPAVVERNAVQTQSAEPVHRVQRAQSSVDNPQHGHEHSDGGHREYHREQRQEHRDLHAGDPSRREHRAYHRQQDREHARDHRSWDRSRNSGSHGDFHDNVSQAHGDLHASDPSRREHREFHRDVSREHDRRHAQWSTHWRDDSRYNWYGYRDRHRSLFRLGRYYDPYGWGYRRWSIGFSLWPSYYGSNYWLNDPWMYRLPPAYGPYRWVRYHDDALLVNIYTGQVVDVIYNFFW